jgi:O-antigen/teichoic acid export membrane protein
VGQRRWSPFDALVDLRLACLCLGLAAALLGIAAWLIVPSAFGGLDFQQVLLIVTALPLALFWGLALIVALAMGRYAAAAAPATANAILTLALTIVLTPTHGVTGSLIAITTAQAATAAGVLVWAQRQRAERESARHSPISARARRVLKAIRFGFPVYTSQAMQVLNSRLDLFLVIGFAGAAAGGRYGVALSLTAALLLLPRAVGMVLLPRLAQLTGALDAEADQLALETRALRHVVIVNLLAALTMTLFLVLLVPTLYGSSFTQTSVLGLILIPGTAALALVGTLSSSLVGRGFNECARRVTLTITPVTLVLYVAIIPALHAVGAAIASSISYTLTFLMWAHFYRRHVNANLAAVMKPSTGELADYRELFIAIWRALGRRLHLKPL